MSLELSVFTGGLVFAVTPKLDAETVRSVLAPALAEKGHPVQSISAVGASGLQVTCDRLLLWLTLEVHSYASSRIRVSAQPLGTIDANGAAASADEASEDAKAMLATTLAVLAMALDAETVNWLSKHISIPAASFAEAALPVTPRRCHSRPQGSGHQRRRLLPGEVTLPEMGSFPIAPRRINAPEGVSPRPVAFRSTRHAGLDFSAKLRHVRQKEEQVADALQSELSLPLRISAWIMTVLVGVFSVPLAWVMFSFNLNRGGDFRITANVLAATAGFSLLHTAGATQVLMAMLFP